MKEQLKITTKEVLGTDQLISINYEALPSDVKINDRILIDDGKIVLKVLSSNSKDEKRNHQWWKFVFK